MVQESTPRARVEHAVARVGEREFVALCLEVLNGGSTDIELLDVLGGATSRALMSGREGGPDGHWPRVWALRAFLYAWDDAAAPGVIDACAHPQWRVREMACKVIKKRELASAGTEAALDRLADDPVPRVRAAARRAAR